MVEEESRDDVDVLCGRECSDGTIAFEEELDGELGLVGEGRVV